MSEQLEWMQDSGTHHFPSFVHQQHAPRKPRLQMCSAVCDSHVVLLMGLATLRPSYWHQNEPMEPKVPRR